MITGGADVVFCNKGADTKQCVWRLPVLASWVHMEFNTLTGLFHWPTQSQPTHQLPSKQTHSPILNL